MEQAVGAIKLRVQEQGGHYTPLTPVKKAELLRAEELYMQDKAGMRFQQGIDIILGNVQTLFAEIERQCREVNAQGHMEIEYEMNVGEPCILRHDRVGMIVHWHQPSRNSLYGSELSVDEYNGRLTFRRELGRVMYLRGAEKVRSASYEPDLSRAREYGWKLSGKSTAFLSSTVLAEKCVLQLMDLIERAAS